MIIQAKRFIVELESYLGFFTSSNFYILWLLPSLRIMKHFPIKRSRLKNEKIKMRLV